MEAIPELKNTSIFDLSQVQKEMFKQTQWNELLEKERPNPNQQRLLSASQQVKIIENKEQIKEQNTNLMKKLHQENEAP